MSSGFEMTVSKVVGRSSARSSSVPFPLASVSTCASGRSASARSAEACSADDDRRLRVAEEIGELALLVARVERQVHEAGAQAGEIERERLPALVHLHGDAIAALRTRVRPARARCAPTRRRDRRSGRQDRPESAGRADPRFPGNARRGARRDWRSCGSVDEPVVPRRARSADACACEPWHPPGDVAPSQHGAASVALPRRRGPWPTASTGGQITFSARSAAISSLP